MIETSPADALAQATCPLSDENVSLYRFPGADVKVRCRGRPELMLIIPASGPEYWVFEPRGPTDSPPQRLGFLKELSVQTAKQRAKALATGSPSVKRLVRPSTKPATVLEKAAQRQPFDAKAWLAAAIQEIRRDDAEILRMPGIEPYVRCKGFPRLQLVVPLKEPEYWLLHLTAYPNKPKICLGTLHELDIVRAVALARRLTRKPRRTADDGPTLGRFLKTYWRRHHQQLKPSTRMSYQSRIRRLDEAFGDLPLTWISRRAVRSWHSEYSTRSPGSADEAKVVLRSVINLAKKWEVIDPAHPNPCDGIPRNRPGIGNRSLSPDELSSLGKVLKVDEQDQRYRNHALRLRFALFSGLRPGEARTLVWSSVVYVDGKPSHLQLPDGKTGPRRIDLNDEAIAILQTQPRMGNGAPVFPSPRGPWVCDQKATAHAWRRAADMAGLPQESCQYWLRHTFGSNAMLTGSTYLETSALLGHSDPTTTRRYLHVPTKATVAAGERIGERIADWLGLPDWLDELEQRRDGTENPKR